MNNKRLRLAIIAGAVLLVLIVVALLSRHSSTTITQRVNVPQTFTTSAAYGENTVVLCNSRGFVSYNLVSGDTVELSEDDPLNGLEGAENLSASPDGNYLLFHTENVTDPGVLAPYLKAHGMDASRDYWWIYSVEHKTYQALPAGSLVAKFDGSDILVLAPGSTGEAITTYHLSDLTRVSSVNIPGSTDFWKYGDGFLLQRPDNTVIYTTDGVVNQAYYQDMTVIGVAPGSDYALATQATEESTQLLRLNLKDKSQSVVDSQLHGQPSWKPSGSVMYQVIHGDGTDFVSYDAVTGKRTVWTFGGSLKDLPQDQTVQVSGLFGATAALISSTSGSLYLAGSGLHAIKDPQGYTSSVNISGQSSDISFDVSNGFNVDYSGTPSSAIISVAKKRITQDGYTPGLYPITVAPNDDDDSSD